MLLELVFELEDEVSELGGVVVLEDEDGVDEFMLPEVVAFVVPLVALVVPVLLFKLNNKI